MPDKPDRRPRRPRDEAEAGGWSTGTDNPDRRPRRPGRRWPPGGLLEQDRREFDPPNAPGIYPWLLLLSGPVWDMAHGKSHPLWLAIAGLVVFAGAWVYTVHYAFYAVTEPEPVPRRGIVSLTVVMVLALVLMGVFGGAWTILPPTAGIAIGVTVRGSAIVTVGGPFTLAAVIVGIINRASPGDLVSLAWGTFTSASIPWIIIRLFTVIGQLRRTREQLAEAAVTEERNRFSRDLHDLLGHTLSVMVVKAEAVRRVIPTDPDTAAAQAADIEQIGRQALVEVRAAVTGYRGRGLTAEVDSARSVLADAGIAPVIRLAPLALQPEADALLGWAVREAVTNVIRHARASICTIELCATGDSAADDTVLTVTDDGTGSGGTVAPGGHGLAGLRERVEAQDGHLEAGPAPDGGFRLRVTVPGGSAALGASGPAGVTDAAADGC